MLKRNIAHHIFCIRCTCFDPVPVCTCTMMDLVEMAVKLINQQDKILKVGESVAEAAEMRVTYNI